MSRKRYHNNNDLDLAVAILFFVAIGFVLGIALMYSVQTPTMAMELCEQYGYQSYAKTESGDYYCVDKDKQLPLYIDGKWLLEPERR